MVKIGARIRRPRAQTAVAPGAALSIAQFARVAGEPPHVIRYYCRIGLLEPNLRSPNGYRRFGPRSLQHLKFIRRAQGLGFTLDEIAAMFHMARSGRSPCPDVREIIARRVPQVSVQLEALVALHARMRRALNRWRRQPDQVPTGDAVCALIESEDAARARRMAAR